ncbi:uncharacterized protein [Henckelia pumila]|uniref:uncharacterized protein n=1 Tax=Henckelia pumila TaxID=405737 RepID=UPI003C6E03B5
MCNSTYNNKVSFIVDSLCLTDYVAAIVIMLLMPRSRSSAAISGLQGLFSFLPSVFFFISQGLIALATATSGVAASILPGGQTTHLRFKIPIDLHANSYCSISEQSGLAQLLRRAAVIIWDEALMCKRFAIEAVDRTLQDLLGNKNPFGGKVVVLGGVFRGIEQTDDNGNIKLPAEMLIKFSDNDTEESERKLLDYVYQDLGKNYQSSTYMTERTIFLTKNVHVDKLNNDIVSLFPGNSRVYLSFDEAIDDTQNSYP